MKKIISKLTVFFVLGVLAAMIGIFFSIVAINSVSAQDALAGMYIILGLIPVLVLIIIDRILVWKFGAKKVNKVQLYILSSLILLFILNWIRLQLQ